MDQPGDVQFDGWTLKRNSGELCKDGRTVRLRPQPLAVLEELLAHPGEVVTREHLVARLWPQGVVDFDTGLNSAMRRLRRALGDDAEVPKYIETFPRKGYRFIAAVTRCAARPTSVTDVQTRGTGLRGAAVSSVAIGILMGLSLTGDASGWLAPGQREARSAVSEQNRRARYFLERSASGDLERARSHFDEVLAVEPDRADALAGLASVYWLEAVQGEISLETGLPKVRAAAERSLSLDSRQAEAHFRLALYSLRTGDAAAGELHMRRARQLDPNHPLVLADQAGDALAAGRLEESVRLSRRAVVAAPLNLPLRYNAACTLYLLGRFDEALQVMQEVLELDSTYRADIVAFIWILRGRYAEASRLAASWVDGPDKQQVLALSYFGLGLRAQADAALDRLIALVRNTDPLRIVEVYAYRREADRAFDWLEAKVAAPYGEGTHTPGFAPATIRFSPFSASLRADPRWDRYRRD